MAAQAFAPKFLALLLAALRRALGLKPANPMLSDPRYRGLMRQEAELRRRHKSVRPVQQARQSLVHQALRGATWPR